MNGCGVDARDKKEKASKCARDWNRKRTASRSTAAECSGEIACKAMRLNSFQGGFGCFADGLQQKGDEVLEGRERKEMNPLGRQQPIDPPGAL